MFALDGGSPPVVLSIARPPAAAAGLWYILRPMPELRYLTAYPDQLRQQAATLLDEGRLGALLRSRYPNPHGLRTDRALYDYVQDLKFEHLRNADPVAKVAYDSKIHVVQHALGLHTAISRVQGSKLKAKHEIRIASVFRDAPLEFLRMIAVHELAHLKEKQHDKAFYKLCCWMEPQYHQFELDLRLYLTHMEQTGERLWAEG